MAAPARQRRIEGEIQRVLAELIAREVKDPRVGATTVTAVELLPDMSGARVLVVPFGDSGDSQALLVGLTRAAGFLRGEVGRRLGLRHAPRLQFEIDTSIERAEKLTRLIDEAVRSDADERH